MRFSCRGESGPARPMSKTRYAAAIESLNLGTLFLCRNIFSGMVVSLVNWSQGRVGRLGARAILPEGA